MPEPCKTVPTEFITPAPPTLAPGAPIPDYSETLRLINDNLIALNALLAQQRAQDIELYPQPGDEDAYVGTTQTIAAGAVTTITYNILKDYIYHFKRLYIDALPNCTYEWSFQSTTEYAGGVVLDGPDHEFGRHIKAKGSSTLTLAVTNTGVVATANISIQSWARRNP